MASGYKAKFLKAERAPIFALGSHDFEKVCGWQVVTKYLHKARIQR
jgi:hypothetical protein